MNVVVIIIDLLEPLLRQHQNKVFQIL